MQDFYFLLFSALFLGVLGVLAVQPAFNAMALMPLRELLDKICHVRVQ
jgi:hypothetical protein